MADKIFLITSLFVILLFHLLSLVNCQLPSAPALYVFGDSLVDCGNNNKLPTLARANYPPYGSNFVDGATGRFTDNETLADIVAQFLGLPLPPAFKSLDLGNFKKLSGVNYASGGVGILPETGKHF
ncbi:GDSL esterase/lipase, partial [Thalictrum thalictroides]